MTDRPETIPFTRLPGKFVVKPSHGSGWVLLVADKTGMDRDAIVATCRDWLARSYYEQTREWVYRNIPPRIIIEEYIDDCTDATPRDYKLFVFDGAVAMIQVDAMRFTNHRRRLYTPHWERIDALLEFDDIIGEVPPPPHLEEMVAAAARLGQGIDFVRADFYDTPQRIYFGELTTTPSCGIDTFCPSEFDRTLGARWTMRMR